MRSDMAKVIVERPRFGHRARGRGKGYRRDDQRIRWDEKPKREGIKKLARGGSKSFNEHLGPLKKFLFKQKGRRWDDVYSEICKHIDRGNIVQKHILTHVTDFVAVDVELIDGIPHHKEGSWRRGQPVYWGFWGPHLYVCPKTGILKRVKRRPQRQAEQPLLLIPRTADTQYVRKDGRWRIVAFEKFRKLLYGVTVSYAADQEYDALHERPLTRDEALRIYGAKIRATDVLPVPKRERQRFCKA